MKRLLAEWLDYKTRVISRDADKVQIEECRRAFYAGAGSLFSVMLNMMTPGLDPSDQDLKNMDDIQKELTDFLDGFKKAHNV